MKRALIIGGSQGIGLGLVGEYLGRGWHITATERTPTPALAALAAKHPGRLVVENVDITRRDRVAALAGRLKGRAFDLLFLNAGIMKGRGQTIVEVSNDDLDAIFLTNATSPVRVADALFDVVVPGGTIAFMSSILGSVSTNDDGRAEVYRASKAALNSLILSFRARHAKADVTVLALHPGVVRTAMAGPSAPLDIETSVRGLADTLAARAGSGGAAFVDYRNEIIPW